MSEPLATTQCKHCNAIIELAPIIVKDSTHRGIKRKRKRKEQLPPAKLPTSSTLPNPSINIYFPLINTWLFSNTPHIVKNTLDIPSTTPRQTK